jgi:hypothetical protein
MELEKNPRTRPIYRKLLELWDLANGVPFPGMKRFKQITSYHCGPAVLVALYSFMGIKTSQKAIVKSLRAQNKIKLYGLNLKDLAKASKIVGKGKFNFWIKSSAKVSDLEAIINKYKWPVGVEWWGIFYEFEDEDSGHYGVVTSIDKKSGYLRLADFFSIFAGVDRKLKIKDFVKRWWDENEIKGRTILDRRMMFIVTPKSESWPRKLGMKKY